MSPVKTGEKRMSCYVNANLVVLDVERYGGSSTTLPSWYAHACQSLKRAYGDDRSITLYDMTSGKYGFALGHDDVQRNKALPMARCLLKLNKEIPDVYVRRWSKKYNSLLFVAGVHNENQDLWYEVTWQGKMTTAALPSFSVPYLECEGCDETGCPDCGGDASEIYNEAENAHDEMYIGMDILTTLASLHADKPEISLLGFPNSSQVA